MPSALAVAMTTTRTIQGLSNERAQNLSICGLYTIARGLIRLPGRSEGRTVQTVTAPMGADAERPPEMRDAPCHREKLWLFLHAPPQRVEATIAVAGKRAKGVPASAVPSSGAKSFEIRFDIRRQRLSVPARFIDLLHDRAGQHLSAGAGRTRTDRIACRSRIGRPPQSPTPKSAMPACLSLALTDLMNRAQCKSEDLRSGILSLLDIVPELTAIRRRAPSSYRLRPDRILLAI